MEDDKKKIEDYLEMIRLKTAVLLAASLKIGALIGGAPQKDADLIYKFGEAIGLAFQLQDDYLDVFAEGKKFGKAIGNDILANRKTFLLLSALQSGEPELVNQLKSWIEKADPSPNEKISAVKSIYEQLRIGELSLKRSDEYFNKALQSLDRVDVSPGKKTELTAMIKVLMNREH